MDTTVRNRRVWWVSVAVLAVAAVFAVRWAISGGPSGQPSAAATATAAAAMTQGVVVGAVTVDVDGAATASGKTELSAQATAWASTVEAATSEAVQGTAAPADAGGAGDTPTPALAGAAIATATAHGAAALTAAAQQVIAPSGTASAVSGATATDSDVSALYIGRSAEGGSIGTYWRLVAVRTGEHDGFTRIVWEFQADAGVPYWRIVQRSTADGAPDTTPAGLLSGTAWLEVIISDVIAMEAPEALEARQAPGSPNVNGVALLLIYDDDRLGFAVGLEQPVAFTAYSLDAPSRLVIDVPHGP